MYQENIPIAAGADLSAAQYKAVAIGGTIAANNGAALGILQNKPAASGRDATVCYAGRSRYVAGAAITAGNRICVTTSGFMVAVTSSDFGVGTALATVSSGEIGEGIFNFAGIRSTVGSAHLT